MSKLFRTEEMQRRLRERMDAISSSSECAICSKAPIQEFKSWRIVRNDYPYDKIAQEHNMLVPMRHVAEKELSQDELSELMDIKLNLDDKYDYIIEAAKKNKSIPAHFHLHLLVVKERF